MRFRHGFDCGLESRTNFLVNAFNYLHVSDFQSFVIKNRPCFGKLTFALAGLSERTCLIS